MTQRTFFFPLEGGLDLVTPAQRIKPGRVLGAKNYEPNDEGGYRRIKGYERFDGLPSPSGAEYAILNFDQGTGTELVAGDVIAGGTSGATGTGGTATLQGGSAAVGEAGAIAGKALVDAGAPNSGTGGIVEIGPTNATAVDIAKPGVTTDIQGLLSVDQAAAFDGQTTVAGGFLTSNSAATTSGSEALTIGSAVDAGLEFCRTRVVVDMSSAANTHAVVTIPAGSVVLAVSSKITGAELTYATATSWAIGISGTIEKYITDDHSEEAVGESQSSIKGDFELLSSSEAIIITSTNGSGISTGTVGGSSQELTVDIVWLQIDEF